MRFKSKTTVLVFGLVLTFLSLLLAVLVVMQLPLPVTVVDTASEWNLETEGQKVILFVHADFNGWMKGEDFEQYCRWFRAEYGRNAILADTTSGRGQVWDILQKLWSDNNISRGSLKSFGGAGRIVWLDDGRLVDWEHIFYIVNLDELEKRTQIAFQPQ